jgi:hypothetical protein
LQNGGAAFFGASAGSQARFDGNGLQLN